MTQHLKIDFVSDVACPWCVIGLRGLEQALADAADAVEADITFHPFELNPGMPAAGQNLVEHIAEKYGSTAEQSAASRAMIRSRGAEIGFTFNMTEESRIYNTFDAHRLLHWAGTVGCQRELKHSLFKANFTDGANVSDHEVLVDAAVAAGLDGNEAREVLASGRYAEAVRDAEREWISRGIRSVPAIVINETWLISGGQPAGAFEQMLRGIAAEIGQASANA
ncbi:DsbA family oxidoreductase [Microvirga makkahensis]|uniref:DsbA family oxidoreductase n=1 Tax=Microvirga makkahensis TaxID=1128670 RepID=A0A7X3MVX2_9HYPH|nr:DsbA family oxidoreductase [Microvirga makkahensis]MXQ14154.1 DsbA family oxidoreductase [Microvirga makkahensis]